MSVLPIGYKPAQTMLGAESDTIAPSPFGYCLACNVRKSSTVLYGIFVELLRHFWSKEADDLNQLPATLYWQPKHSNLAIEAEYEFSRNKSADDPKNLIGVKLGSIVFSSPPATAPSGFLHSDKSTSQTSYSRVGTGTALLSHVGTTNAQSLMMADRTHELFEAFAPVIRADLDFVSFNVTQRPPVAEHPKQWYGTERFVHDVEISFSYETTWTLVQEAPKLREIIFNAGQRVVDRFIINATKTP